MGNSNEDLTAPADITKGDMALLQTRIDALENVVGAIAIKLGVSEATAKNWAVEAGYASPEECSSVLDDAGFVVSALSRTPKQGKQ